MEDLQDAGLDGLYNSFLLLSIYEIGISQLKAIQIGVCFSSVESRCCVGAPPLEHQSWCIHASTLRDR